MMICVRLYYINLRTRNLFRLYRAILRIARFSCHVYLVLIKCDTIRMKNYMVLQERKEENNIILLMQRELGVGHMWTNITCVTVVIDVSRSTISAYVFFFFSPSMINRK